MGPGVTHAMANPTTQVPSTVQNYEDTKFYWPVIGGATVAKTYQTGEMIGRRSDGYCGSFDDTAAMTFLGLMDETVPFQIVAGDANGAKVMKIVRPYRLEMPLDSSTVSRVTNIGARMYAADSGHASLSPGTFGNVIGSLVDVSGALMPNALTGATAVIAPVSASAAGLTGGGLTTGPGTGITSGTGTVEKTGVFSYGGVIRTDILIDLTGLGSSTTDLDIIGNGTGPAYLGQVTAAQNGTVWAGTLQCLEVPAGGVTDIDLYWATEATGKFDDAVSGLTETALITAGGAWTLALTKAIADPVGIANGYLYLTCGAAGTPGTYTAGKFVLTLWGY